MHALLGFVSASDLRIAGRVRRWSPPRWFCLAMLAATRFGDGPGWIATAALLAFVGPRGREALAAGTVASAAATVAFAALKRRFRRPRPCETAPHPLFAVRPPDRFSFPSGHTMNAFAIAHVLAVQFPEAAGPVWLLAASIGLSRVVLGLHYPSDVLAGAALGAAFGGLAAAALLA